MGQPDAPSGQRSLALGLFAQTAGTRILGFASSAALVVLLSRGLDPAEYGVYAILTTTYVFGNLLVGLNLSANLTRRIPGMEATEGARTFLTLMVAEVGIAAGAIVVAVLAGIDRVLARALGIEGYAFELRLVMALTGADLVVGSALQFLLARKLFARANLLTLLRASLLAPLLAIWQLGGGMITIRVLVGCWWVSTLCAIVYGLSAASIRRAIAAGPSWKTLRGAVRFGVMVGFQSLTFYFLKLADRYFLTASATLEEIGIYSFAYSISNMIYSLSVLVLTGLFYPHIVEAHNASDLVRRDALLAQLTRIAFALLTIAIVVSVLSMRHLLFFARPEYMESAAIVPWLLLMLFTLVAAVPASIILILENRLVANLACGASGLLVGILGYVFLIPRFSYWGALVSAAAGYATVAILQNTVAGTWRFLEPRGFLLLGRDVGRFLGRGGVGPETR